MSEQPEGKSAVTKVLQDSEQEIQGVTVTIKRIDPKAKGFLPLWRKVLSLKRAMMNFDNALPEDVDQATSFLMQYIVRPQSMYEKRQLLDNLTAEEVMELFNMILGAGEVPPVNGGA